MTSRAPYFRRRRRLLGKMRRCTRCGAFTPADGHKLCAACIEEKKLKRADPPAQRKRIEKRLGEIELIRGRLLERFGRTA